MCCCTRCKSSLWTAATCCFVTWTFGQSCRQVTHSESEQALRRRVDEVTSELRTEQSKSSSLQATLEKSQQDGDALSGENRQGSPRLPLHCLELPKFVMTVVSAFWRWFRRMPAAHWEIGGRVEGAFCPGGFRHCPDEWGAGGEKPTYRESSFGQLSPGGQSVW